MVVDCRHHDWTEYGAESKQGSAREGAEDLRNVKRQMPETPDNAKYDAGG